jgi:hypothetical protein
MLCKKTDIPILSTVGQNNKKVCQYILLAKLNSYTSRRSIKKTATPIKEEFESI